MQHTIKLTVEAFDGEKHRHDLTHWHDKIELIRIMEGNAHCVINGENGLMEAGDICIINRQQLHMIYCEKNSCTIQRLLIDPIVFVSNKIIYDKYLVPTLTDPTLTHIKVGRRESADIAKLMDRMSELYRVASIGYELELVAMVYLLFQRLYMLYLAEVGKRTAAATMDLVLFRRMADYIYHNYHQKVDLEDIAAAGNVSKSKCGSVFKEYAGHTPFDFLNLYRLQISTDLLQSTDKSIAEIACSCGFGQQSYYNRLFLREYGVTPKEYRENAN